MDAVERQLRILDKQRHERRNFYPDLFKKSPLLFCAIGLMGGIILQNNFALPLYLWMALLACTVIAATALWATARVAPTGRATQTVYITGYLAAIAFACLGAIRLSTYSTPASNDIRVLFGEDKTLATVRGIIVSEPLQEDRGEWEFADFTFTDPSTSFYLSVTEVKCVDGWQKAAGTVRVQVAEPVLDLKIGDYIQAYCWLDRFKPAQNPGQFDVAAYLARRNVYVVAFVKTRGGVELIKRPQTPTMAAFLSNLKLKARQLLLGQTLVENDEQAMLAALLLGQRNTISSDIITAFYKTGLIHILALSGGHVAALIGIVWWFAKAAGFTKRWRAAMALFFITLFTLVVPPDATVLRASIIGIFFCISLLIRRTPNSVNTLALSAIILVLLRPLEFYEAGWQLSFACVLGILLLTGKIENFIHGKTTDWFLLDDGQNRLFSSIKRNGSYLIMILSAGIAATIGGAGILLYHFYTITPLTSVWTIIVTPLVSLILLVGFLKIVLGVLLPTLAEALGALTIPLSKLFIYTVNLMAHIDTSQILIGAVPKCFVLFYYAAAIFIAFVYLKNHRIKRGFCFATVIILVGTLGYYKFQRTYRSHLELSCLSVGHGQAIVAKLPGTANIIFDAGSMSSKDIGRRVVIPFLNYSGIGSIDAIFVGHYDVDHINGVAEIVGQRPVEHIYCDSAIRAQNGQLPKTAEFLSKCLNKYGKQLETAPPQLAGQSDARISIVWPSKENPPPSLLQPNNLSQVVLIEYEGRRILLCSDIEKQTQDQIIALHPDLNVDILLLPHHGSTTTLSQAFVEKLRPSVLLCSCSRSQFQKYLSGHTADTRSFYTCRDGAVTVTIDKDRGTKVLTFLDAQKNSPHNR